MSLEAQVAHLQRAVEALTVDLENAEVSLRSERRKVSTLKNELNKQSRQAEEGDPEVIFEVWKALCKTSSRRVVFTEKRRKAVADRLKEYTVEDILQAVRGASHSAYVDDKGTRHDDLELICRDGTYVEKFRDRHEAFLRWQQGLLKGFPENAPPIIQRLTHSCGDPVQHGTLLYFRCPACRFAWHDLVWKPLGIRLDGKAALCEHCGADDHLVDQALEKMEERHLRVVA